jgi:poly-gamma-glutamate capsule biosynthesis protein CapA/YwtB (metallophosphatase superfamily)
MRVRRAAVSAALAMVLTAAACTSTPDETGTGTGSGATGQAPVTSSSTDPSDDAPSTIDQTEEPPFEPRKLTVVMNGDMLLHEGLWASAQIDAQRTGRGDMDFRPILADLKPVVSEADLAICHMETPLAPPGGPYSGYPLFSAPPAIVPALKWEGYDACTTASNHSIDQGFDGLVRTLDDFADAGIATAGTAATKEDSRDPLMLDVNGVSVALISATYGTNGIPLPADEPWSVPIIDTDKISRMAARAKDDGAQLVLVALHWGTEYYHPPTEYQLDVARALTKSPDIDFIYGHHAHVVQPYDKVNGTWVVYGLGNAVAQQDTSVEGVYDGNTCRVTFTEREDGSFEVTKLQYIPTMITTFDGSNPMRWLNVPQDLDDPDYSGSRSALEATGQRVTDVVGSLGAFKKGVTEGK